MMTEGGKTKKFEESEESKKVVPPKIQSRKGPRCIGMTRVFGSKEESSSYCLQSGLRRADDILRSVPHELQR